MSDTQTPKPAKKPDITDHMKNGKTPNFVDNLEDMPTGEEAEKKDKPFFNCTDYGNSKRFVAMHGEHVRFPKSLGWMVWNGKCWMEDTTSAVVRLAADTIQQIKKDAAEEKDEDKQKALFKHYYLSEGKKRMEATYQLAGTQLPIATSGEEFDRDPWLFNCQNGTIDLRTGSFSQHNPKQLITQISPSVFDPKAQCPTWLSFLRRVTAENEELLSFLQRSVGYTLTGMTGEQKFFLCWGEGRNGKGSFLNTLFWLLGDYAKAARFNTFEETQERANNPRGDLVSLRGKRLVMSSESKEKTVLAEATIKSITGGDPLTARQLHKEEITFTPAFKLWLMTNHKPIIKGTDEAIWERVLLIPWVVYIPPEERDPDLAEKLKAEASGILNWALNGCSTWQRQGLKPPEQVKAATKEYRQEMDAVVSFIEARCTTANKEARVKSSKLYEEFCRFATEEGELEINQKAFSQRLARMGFKKKENHGMWWIGLGLLTGNSDS